MCIYVHASVTHKFHVHVHSAHDISVYCLIVIGVEMIMTFNNGSLGSCIDEERSEVRKVMRFACSVSHRIFERIWHLLVILKGMPVWESFTLLIHSSTCLIDMVSDMDIIHQWLSWIVHDCVVIEWHYCAVVDRPILLPLLMISNQARLPAELKHISKRRKRN